MTPPAEVFFFSEDTPFTLEREQDYCEWIGKILRDEGLSFQSLNFIFCSDDYLLNLNRKYLNHDYFTDILTFEYTRDPLEADIFISIDRVKENAKIRSLSFENELARVMVHGILHLAGFEDKTESEMKRMRAHEDHYLSNFDCKR